MPIFAYYCGRTFITAGQAMTNFGRITFSAAIMLALTPAAVAQQQTAPKPAAPAAAPNPAAQKPAAPKPAAPAAQPAAANPAAGATLLGQFGDWGAYTANPGGKKVCFALGKPNSSTTNPPGRPRDPAFLFVSTRPSEKVKEEVSVIIGYPFKNGSEAAVQVGPTNFALYTQNDGAWIKNAAEEARMVESMKKGADAVVKGESGRGTKTTDTFSLKGLDQALTRIAQECK